PSSSTIGSRRRAAAIASPSRVCAFSRTRSSSRAACQVARSTTGGLPGRLLLALPGVVVMVSSAVGSRALAGSGWDTLSRDDSRGSDYSIPAPSSTPQENRDLVPGRGLEPLTCSLRAGSAIAPCPPAKTLASWAPNEPNYLVN